MPNVKVVQKKNQSLSMRPKRNNIPEHIVTPVELVNKYLRWLYYEVLFPYQREIPEYWLLCNYLFRKEFFWSIPNDDNRAADGLQFRNDFGVKYFRAYEIWWDASCTVFEMLVALACRMEDILENPMRSSYIGDWFILLISNLGLKDFTDDNWSSDKEKIVDKKLDILLNRKYDKYGNGSLFPLENSNVKDQRKVEIWYQLMSYIDESFDI